MAHVEDVPAADRCAAGPPNPQHPTRPDIEDAPSARPPLPPEPDSPVIEGVEDDGDWRCYREQTLATLGPVGFAEAELAEAIALLSWRLRRVGRLEAEALADGFARQKEAAGSPPRGRIGACERVLAVICRYEGRIERARDRAAKGLRALQEARRAAGPTVSEPAAASHPRTTPRPGPEAPGSFGRIAEAPAGDRPSVAPDSSEPRARHDNRGTTFTEGPSPNCLKTASLASFGACLSRSQAFLGRGETSVAHSPGATDQREKRKTHHGDAEDTATHGEDRPTILASGGHPPPVRPYSPGETAAPIPWLETERPGLG